MSLNTPASFIERASYGPHQLPYELADPVPTWQDIQAIPDRHQEAAGLVVSRNHSWPECWNLRYPGGNFMAIPEIEVRWWIAVAIAVAAGCPPHWIDMGFIPYQQLGLDTPGWGRVTAFLSVTPLRDGHWHTSRLPAGYPAERTDHPSELDARCWAANHLNIPWGTP